jgi:hypothetical protein
MSLKCPSCQSYLPSNAAGPSTTNAYLQTSGSAKILARYVNEGGVQEDLDVLPTLTEEAYLEAHPDTQPARALLLMCAEGDVTGIVELLRNAADSLGDASPELMRLICYQDPLYGMKNGLQLAVEKSQIEVVWLLLWVASALPLAAFPDQARAAAESMQLGRLEFNAGQDIRSLTNENGETAADLAQELGGIWTPLVEAGVLRI